MLVRHVLGCHGHRQVRTPVIRMLNHDNGLTLGVGARDLHGVFYRFGTGVKQCRTLGVITGRESVQRFTHFDVSLIGRDHEARVREQGDLILHAGYDLGIGVTHRCHGDSRAQVDQVVAIDINQDSASCSFNKDGQGGADSAGHSSGSALHERIRLGAWNSGNDPSFLRDIKFLGQRRKAHAL